MTADLPAQDGHTTHLNAADRDGNIIAMTLTHGPRWFGSGLVVPGTGMVLNNGLGLFSTPQPGERAPSNMTPALARTALGHWLALGTPGARRIVSLVALTLQQALAGRPWPNLMRLPRIHHDGGRRLYLSTELEHRAGLELAAMGWEIETLARGHYFGPASMIEAGNAGLRGAIDGWFRPL